MTITRLDIRLDENNLFDQFLSASEKAKEPGKALIQAAEFTKENGF